MKHEEQIYDHYLAWAERLGLPQNVMADRATYERVANSINSIQLSMMPAKRGGFRASGGSDS